MKKSEVLAESITMYKHKINGETYKPRIKGRYFYYKNEKFLCWSAAIHKNDVWYWPSLFRPSSGIHYAIKAWYRLEGKI